MIPPALVGIICGWLLMPHIPSQRFGHLIGWLTVALIALVLVQKLAPRLINFAGVFVGRWLLGMINQSLFEWLMIVFSLVGALRLIIV
jgi:uncharacterized membrane protein YfcA